MFFLSGIILSIFLFLLLLMKREKTRADLILAVWIGFLTIHQLLFYYSREPFFQDFPHLLGLTLPLPLLHGVFLFFYVGEMTRLHPIRLRRDWFHFVPFLILLLLAIPFYILSGEDKVRVFQNEGAGFEWYMSLQLLTILISGLAYVYASLRMIRQYRRSIVEYVSNTDKKMLRWLEYLSLGLGCIWLLVVFFDDPVIFSGVVLMVLFIGFFGINQMPVFYLPLELAAPALDSEQGPDNGAIEKEEVARERYAKSGLKSEEGQHLLKRLHALMEDEKLYRNSELTLLDLAERLHIHPNYVSQVLNEFEEKNFFHFVNSRRVEDFIESASKPASRQFTYLSLAYDSGFQSKSTFYKYFKLHTGKTPAEFFRDTSN